MTRNAKIVCTLGPEPADRDAITGLTRAEISVVQLNASLGTTDERREFIALVRDIDDRTAKLQFDPH